MGIVIGGVAFLALVAAVVWYFFLRPPKSTITPIMSENQVVLLG